jgi:gliding motility-associated protein GldL
MFVLTAFDRPPRTYQWEDVFPALKKGDGNDEDADTDATAASGVIITGQVGAQMGVTSGVAAANQAAAGNAPLQAPVLSGAATPAEVMNQVTDATQLYLNQITEMTNELRHLQDTTRSLNQVSDVLLESYKAITENSENITRSSSGYVEQMQDLNRNINGLNAIYEIQLKSVSSQLDSIDRVNRGIKDIRDMYEKSSNSSARYCEETEKMARYMQQLNGVYEKMITAMTINMYRPMVNPNDIPTPPTPPTSATTNNNQANN